ncbi:serpin family protein [Fadolivirus algeromassiliense]|jgi:serpin B/serpin B11/12|uniref:Serpin family protein n=1 Tax=Fadolivirus FV1/VV64 TaxID=3070911 RepID=A0A7D3UUI4_9VIRU|nr:serpin family protein [Fadolivirus algeromassiliense]QKF93509.1 serpin family protein [Fadolivirus FV1/VV64]
MATQTFSPLNKCTYAITGNTHQNQAWRHCYTCFEDLNEGVCLNCASLCHDGHNLSPVKTGLFFCDCGANRLCKQGEFKTPQPIMCPYPFNPSVPIQQPPKKQRYEWCGTKPNYTPPGMFNAYDDGYYHDDDISHNNSLDSQVVGYNNTLATKVFNSMSPNRIFSPMSIAYALSLLHLGSNGNTDTEIRQLFGGKYTLSNLQTIYSLFNNNVVKMANCLAINDKLSINPEYLTMLKDIALISIEDFSNSAYVTQKLNAFVEMNTNGLIKNVFDSIDPSTLAILINTIYFKANWLHKFNKALTQQADFTNSQCTVQVNMMNIKKKFPYYENQNMQMIELPYVGNEYCMGIILPKQVGYIPSMNVSNLSQYINQLDCMDEVNVFIPKFTHRKNIDLGSVLQNLGVKELFTPYANLSKILNGIYVSKAIHEAVVIVDEEGTEAAAVTTFMLEKCCMEIPRNIVFRADHSFIYYIRHIPTNTMLFVGDYHGN